MRRLKLSAWRDNQVLRDELDSLKKEMTEKIMIVREREEHFQKLKKNQNFQKIPNFFKKVNIFEKFQKSLNNTYLRNG